MLKRKILGVVLLNALLLPAFTFAQNSSAGAPARGVYTAPKADIDKIRDEGLNRSKVMEHLSYLTDVIGGRLTNSPNMKRANEWTRDTMAKWGMQNAKLEPWGPFGRGWSLKSFNAQVTDPTAFPVIAYPKAWSPSTKGVVSSDVVFLDVNAVEDFAKYRGQLQGKIVLIAKPREVKAAFEGLGVRYSDAELVKLSEQPDPATVTRPQAPAFTPEQQAERTRQQQFGGQLHRFLLDEGVAVIVDNSRIGSGGTLFVSSASSAPATATPAAPATGPAAPVLRFTKEIEVRMVPQMTMATEDYNRLVRMIKLGAKPRMTVDIQAQYHDEDLMGYNTTAEIPGTDPKLKDELVMLGGHLDSWHSSTGATDNAAGCAVAMEAARILIASGLKPRRTIRVALWSGEEQGLIGSRQYVLQKFGEMKGGGNRFGPPDPNAPKPELIKKADYDKLSAYYNLDNGTGKIRGVYMQGNAAVRPYFEAWLAPFSDLGARTLTMSNTGGTDHLSFDAIGLPGFQFIQDEIEYDTRTHHSNQDNYDRIQADDMKQAAVIMAAFVYQTAMMDEKMPRKPMR
ncbi:MAG TPA: M20/M25/M40 family metallo-hydrolase [Pyrinomonadaceae bacterium]|nr:M20/M25/M40 family metallo-hydrolase [Pyrinomonadaceae bacterium]